MNIIEASSVVVSNDETSKILFVDKNTKLENFYQQIINKFHFNNYNLKIYYYEGYSHEKYFITTEKEYVIANKKGVEYFYFCSNDSEISNNAEDIDYIKYYSVIIFSPIKKLNSEYQNEQRKKMKINEVSLNQNNNNINNKIDNNINDRNVMMNKTMMNPMMMNPMMMNPMMMNQMNMNPMMMNQMMMNPMMMNQMNMNPIMMNQMMMNQMMFQKGMMMNYNMINPMMINNMMNQLFSIYSNNPNMGLNLIRQFNPKFLTHCLQILEKNNKNKENNINISNNNNLDIIQEYQTIDTEKNPFNKYIENAINISYTMKKEILKQSQLHPEKFVNIVTTLSSPGLLSNNIPSNEDYKYILCLIGKILENNGIIVGIYREYNKKDRIDLSAIQFIFSGLINKKKYKLKFNVNEDTIICLNHDLSFRKIFINKWKDIIANKLNIDKKLIILTNPRQRGNLYLDLAFNPQVPFLEENYIKGKLIEGELIDCQMLPLLEACRLSPSIFDIRYHKFYSNNNNMNQIIQRRGREEYISPISWTAYGINISGKYDFGDDKWLGHNNGIGEFAVAYYGINNLFNHNLNMVQNLFHLMGNLESGRTFINVNNIRNPGEKCKTGAYFYKNPNYAENSSETINIGGFEYKIMFMCRVNPSKIRQPETFQDCWILSPTPEEVRPYKILIKKIPKSPLAIASQQVIKMCFTSPDPSYFQILQQKDESFFNKKIGSQFSHLSNYDYVLKLYSQSSTINTYLRDPNNQYYNINDSKSNVWCLHKACTQNYPKIENGTILYRGVCFRLPNNIGVGTKFYFPEFLSTSRDINIAKNIAGQGTLMYITILNNGTNGKKVYCRDIEYISDYPNQKEILFTSYCQFKVTKIEKTPTLDHLYIICEGYNFED